MELHLIPGHRTSPGGFTPTVQTGPRRVREAWCLFMILFRQGQSWDWNQQFQPRAHAPNHYPAILFPRKRYMSFLLLGLDAANKYP